MASPFQRSAFFVQLMGSFNFRPTNQADIAAAISSSPVSPRGASLVPTFKTMAYIAAMGKLPPPVQVEVLAQLIKLEYKVKTRHYAFGKLIFKN